MSDEAPGAAGRPGGDIRVRVIAGVVLGVVALLVAWLGGWIATMAMTVVAAVVFSEWARITGPALSSFAVATPGTFLAAGVLLTGDGLPLAVGLVLVGAVLAAVVGRSLWLVGGVFYAAAPAIALVLVRHDAGEGLAALLFVFAVVWAADSGAYLVGRAVGGPKLWPRVSPKKTWSGFAGGLAAGLAAGLGVAAAAGFLPTVGLAAVALALALASVAGDLLESAVKRRFGVKDAGTIIPGHGGLMDRVDGLYASALLALAIGAAHAGLGDIGGGLLNW